MIPIVYDACNQRAKDILFYDDLIQKLLPKKIADIGCGTGRLTLSFAKYAEVVAIDPNERAIQFAKTKAGAQNIDWRIGSTEQLEKDAYDAIFMTGNTSQVFLEDRDWEEAVRNSYGALKRGGTFVFDTRNPNAHIWDIWMRDDSPDFVKVGEELYEVHIDYNGYVNEVFRFKETLYKGEEALEQVDYALRFRSTEQWQQSLENVGFDVKIYGDYTLTDATHTSEDVVFVATKRG